MAGKFKKIGLVGVGVLIGAALTLNYSATASKDTAPLPIEDLRAFSEIFGKIKSDYVEPVEDKKLITEAINGMLSGLDPHSARATPMTRPGATPTASATCARPCRGSR